MCFFTLVLLLLLPPSHVSANSFVVCVCLRVCLRANYKSVYDFLFTPFKKAGSFRLSRFHTPLYIVNVYIYVQMIAYGKICCVLCTCKLIQYLCVHDFLCIRVCLIQAEKCSAICLSSFLLLLLTTLLFDYYIVVLTIFRVYLICLQHFYSTVLTLITIFCCCCCWAATVVIIAAAAAAAVTVASDVSSIMVWLKRTFVPLSRITCIYACSGIHVIVLWLLSFKTCLAYNIFILNVAKKINRICLIHSIIHHTLYFSKTKILEFYLNF